MLYIMNDSPHLSAFFCRRGYFKPTVNDNEQLMLEQLEQSFAVNQQKLRRLASKFDK